MQGSAPIDSPSEPSMGARCCRGYQAVREFGNPRFSGSLDLSVVVVLGGVAVRTTARWQLEISRGSPAASPPLISTEGVLLAGPQ